MLHFGVALALASARASVSYYRRKLVSDQYRTASLHLRVTVRGSLELEGTKCRRLSSPWALPQLYGQQLYTFWS